MLILQADHTIVSLAVLGCVSYCRCQVRAVQAKLLPTLILVAAGIASLMSGDASLIIAVERFICLSGRAQGPAHALLGFP